jgi:DNA ligase-1
MTRFARLFAAIDQTTSTNAKVQAMVDYLTAAAPRDAAWAVFFLTGRRFKRLISSRALGTWASAETGIDEWLIRECLSVVGDGAETAALVLDRLPVTAESTLSLADWIEDRIMPLRNRPPAEQRRQVMTWIRELERWERFTLFKLLTGELRVGVSHGLVVRAVSATAAQPVATIAARMTGDWHPSAEWYAALVAAADDPADHLRPYPFFLASPLEDASPRPDDLSVLLGPASEWLVEWKWDGIRAQLVKRHGRLQLWSRGEELITERFPEVIAAASGLPDGLVLDGEVLAYRAGRPLPFSSLQQRIGRQRHVARLAREVPAVFMAYDVLEHDGADIRERPLSARRELLDALIAAARSVPAASTAPPADRLPFPGEEGSSRDDRPPSPLVTSPPLEVADWSGAASLRARSRDEGVEGLMLKRWTSPYRVGRKRGDWWKWKIEPYTIDAVLIYAQPGSGKRASLLTDYTFALWHGGELVPVAKAYSGLTNEEIMEVDRWIRRHTLERFGPVRHVMPVQVFELGFEAIARSTRHRSGVAVRFPRMLRWRKDKAASEADTLERLVAMIDASQP